MERKQFWPNKRHDEIYATTEILFSFPPFPEPKDSIRLWIRRSKTPGGSRMSRLPCVLVETGNLRSYSRSSSLHERLDSSKRLGQDPDPTAGFFVRGVRTRRERAAACLGAGGN